MSNYSIKTRSCIFTFVAAIALTTSTLRADIISGDFSGPGAQQAPNGVSFSPAIITDVQTIVFDVANVDDVTFEANFTLIDAGIQILVNGTPLFTTPSDVTQFGPEGTFISNPTTDNNGNAFENLGFAFNALPGDLPRLTVNSDSTGTSFSGNNQTVINNATGDITPVTYTPGFLVATFSDLLVANESNTIVIQNINANAFANLAGDFEVVSSAATAVPEPASVLGLIALIGTMSLRRRRA